MNLFPRNPGPTATRQPTRWARCWAHRVLDAARAGLDVDDALVNQALRITGDLT
jgi:hypothetical protein